MQNIQDRHEKFLKKKELAYSSKLNDIQRKFAESKEKVKALKEEKEQKEIEKKFKKLEAIVNNNSNLFSVRIQEEKQRSD